MVVADSLGRELLPLDEIIAKENDIDRRSDETTAEEKDTDIDRRFEKITRSLADEGLGATAVSAMVHVAA